MSYTRNPRKHCTHLLCLALALLGLTTSTMPVYSWRRATAPASNPRPANNAREQESDSSTPTEVDRANRMRVSEAYGKLPLSFEENQGQTDRKVKFLSRGQGYTLLLTPTEAVLSLRSGKAADAASEKTRLEAHEMQSSVLRMKLMGANQSPQIEGRGPLQGKSNYLIGSDSQKWRTDIPHFARVYYSAVYPGIDLVYYGTNQRRLEYDFIVAPGADAGRIRLSFEGADEMSLDADGSLRLKMKGGEVTQPAPVIYQKTTSGERQLVAGRYVLKGEREVVFELAEYDRSRELVIDPQLLYATFYGGSADDNGEDIAVDSSGNAYITGFTTSTNLTLKSAIDGLVAGFDAFVVKLNPSGTDIVYATYLGSSSNDSGDSIAVTSDGKACVTGLTDNEGNNSDFPTTSNRFQGNGFGLGSRDQDCFVTMLTAAGNGLFYSTFFGGNAAEGGNGIAVDAANKIYIAGETFSEDLPTKNAFQNNRAGFGSGRDAFIAKFDPAQSGNSSLIYSSFLGGSNSNLAGDYANDIAVTPAGVAFMVGATDASDFPTKSSSSLPPFQTTHRGVEDAFIAKVSPSGALIYATLFGGNDEDQALGVAVDSDERAYVTGNTLSSAATFPLRNAFQPNRIGSAEDAFVAKFNSDGTTLFYSSFLGGGNINNKGSGIAVDAGGNAYVTGTSVVFNDSLTVNGFPASVPNGGGLVAKIEASDATGTTIPKILYMDGFGTAGNDIALDPRGNVYIVGTNSGLFPTTAGAFQETYNGGIRDATIAKIGSTFPDTIGIFRPTTALRAIPFQLRNSNTAGPANLTVDFGQVGDQPLAGDWDGDGIDNVGVFRPSTGQFLLRQPTRLQFGGIIDISLTLNFGQAGDKAVVGDWNGDGIDTPGVFRPSTGQFLLTDGPNTNGSTPAVNQTAQFGAAGDTPVAGDFDGNGIDTIGVFRTGAECAFLLSNNNSTIDINVNGFCIGSGIIAQPVVGDWNGDGVDTVSVRNPATNTFFLRNNNDPFAAPADLIFIFGQSGDIPVAGDWDGKPASNIPPNSGINDPADGSSGAGQAQVFTTTCSDPDGWHDIHTIDFKIARSNGNGQGVPIALWAQFDENQNLIRLYDPDLQAWREGVPGSNVVLENGYVRLNLAGTTVQGSGPKGPSVQVKWEVVFTKAATGKNYKQYLKITDDSGASTGFDAVGSWSVLK